MYNNGIRKVLKNSEDPIIVNISARSRAHFGSMFGPDGGFRQPENIVRKAKTMRCERGSFIAKGCKRQAPQSQVRTGAIWRCDILQVQPR